MGENGKELEVKFLVPDLEPLSLRLQSLGAGLRQERTYEVNLRFDTPGGDLKRLHQVLRLRQDTASRLTFKGPGEAFQGIQLRQELEFTVSDFQIAQAFLEALGYQVVWMYEKYRTVYAFGPVLVALDEMPYGNFFEVEGPDGASIQAAVERLGVDWDRRILDSYAILFERVREKLGFSFRDLSFENFKNFRPSPEVFGVGWGMNPG
jgi:adenylate cyclase class 2